MFQIERRFLSVPLKVRWGGWQSDTFTLQQAGWEISAEEDIQYHAFRVALRHRDFQMYGISGHIQHDFFESAHNPHLLRNVVIPINYMASKLTLHVHGSLDKFRPIDAQPQFVDMGDKVMDIEDFRIFAAPLARTEEIIVDPSDVAALLDMVHQAQLPEQEQIRRREALRQNREGMVLDSVPRQQFHAQILSIA